MGIKVFPGESATGAVVFANAPTGAAGRVGTATLVAGTVTVNTTAVTAASVILATAKVVSGTQGILAISAQTAGVSFVITSSNVADTSTVNWTVLN